MAEWFKAPVLKTGVPARVPWVRIPPLPPEQIDIVDVFGFFCPCAQSSAQWFADPDTLFAVAAAVVLAIVAIGKLIERIWLRDHFPLDT